MQPETTFGEAQDRDHSRLGSSEVVALTLAKHSRFRNAADSTDGRAGRLIGQAGGRAGASNGPMHMFKRLLPGDHVTPD
jgi:hypothetical protein